MRERRDAAPASTLPQTKRDSTYVLVWGVVGPKFTTVRFRQAFVVSTMASAFDSLNALAHLQDFMFGQVLDEYGLVLANQAPVSVELQTRKMRWPGLRSNIWFRV